MPRFFKPWRLQFESRVQDQLCPGPEKVRVREVIEAVEQAHSLQELENVKKLKGSDRYYRIRIGDYRISLAVEKDIVTFVRLLHRKDVYRYFP